MKNFFKRKLVIVSLSFVLVGLLTFAILLTMPKSKTYTSLQTSELSGEKFNLKIKFLDDEVLRTYYSYEDGGIGSEEEYYYEIKNKTLYIEGNSLGKIDAFGIYSYSKNIDGTNLDTTYKCVPAIYAKITSLSLMALGGVMFATAVCIELTKRKKLVN